MEVPGAVAVRPKVGKLVQVDTQKKDTITMVEIMTVSHMAVKASQTDFLNSQNISPMDMLPMHWKLENMHFPVRHILHLQHRLMSVKKYSYFIFWEALKFSSFKNPM